MDGARLNDLIYRGRGKVADHIGLPFYVYRPSTINSPFTLRVATLNVALNAADSKYSKPNLYGKPVWYADMDGRDVCAGDYLVRVSDGKAWFVGAKQPLLPIVAIDCNARVVCLRESASNSFGVQPYSGVIDPPAVAGTLDWRWPASILLGAKPLAAIGLPSDVKEGGFRMLLPKSFPLVVQSGDIFVDEQERRFVTESAELTDLGWRLTVNEAHT